LHFNDTEPRYMYTLFRLSVSRQAVHLFFYVTPKVKVLRSFETSVTKRPTTQSHIPEDLSLHLTLVRRHRMCGGLASHLAYTRYDY